MEILKKSNNSKRIEGGVMIRPIMHGRIEAISKERETWTQAQIEKRFKLSMSQSSSLISRAIDYGVICSERDARGRYKVINRDFKFEYT